MYLNLYYEEEALKPLAEQLKEAYKGLVSWEKGASKHLVLGYCQYIPGEKALFIQEGDPKDSTDNTLFVRSLTGFCQDASAILELNKRLFAWQKDWLADWPSLYRVTDADNHLVYSNGRPSDPFDFPSHLNLDYQLDPLMLEQIQRSSKDQLLEAIPLADKESFWVHRYQGLRDASGQWRGVVESTEDILPLIYWYLEETYQGLVSLSDTTSGPSVAATDSDEIN
ncbi:hypothetical protein [Streptococcus sp. DD12]|uniref:hypothetical protein n=1 Tax=Streptococcus sp. DD12 TaxID=1777880 RepID=UPI0007973087|nr:hypothetical protein [Streptococcus sp. DD12]KXT76510.1 Na+ driven multidrug efflux pump [Streptococcus sp. DD12]